MFTTPGEFVLLKKKNILIQPEFTFKRNIYSLSNQHAANLSFWAVFLG